MMDNNFPKISYQKWLDRKLEDLKKVGSTPTLLLHSCCAPCSSYVIEYLSIFFSITIFFYNPNIHPEEEYIKRLEEQISLINRLQTKNRVNFIAGLYEPDLFFKKVKGLEQEKEGGQRCFKCFELRLKRTAQKACESDFQYFTTTLTVSPHKNAGLINRLGHNISSAYHVQYLFSDFKKNSGFQRSILLSNKYQLYRQNYCGCVFSKKQD